jgi:hypothetical protein
VGGSSDHASPFENLEDRAVFGVILAGAALGLVYVAVAEIQALRKRLDAVEAELREVRAAGRAV